MKIKDQISKSIQEFPSLYKSKNYEESKLKVLDHLFFVIGGGLEFAETETPEEGGYITEPKFKKIDGEWERKKDKPYGKEKYAAIPEDYFDSIVYYVYGTQEPIIHVRKDRYRTKVYYKFPKHKHEFEKPKLYEAFSEHKFRPYPISKNFSLACDVLYKNTFLQDDWMAELLILCKRTLEYFNDENQYKENIYYPKDSKIKQDVKYFEETFSKRGVEGVRDLRKTWGYAAKNDCPDYEEVRARKQESWDKFIKEQKAFLNEFIKKFDK